MSSITLIAMHNQFAISSMKMRKKINKFTIGHLYRDNEHFTSCAFVTSQKKKSFFSWILSDDKYTRCWQVIQTVWNWLTCNSRPEIPFCSFTRHNDIQPLQSVSIPRYMHTCIYSVYSPFGKKKICSEQNQVYQCFFIMTQTAKTLVLFFSILLSGLVQKRSRDTQEFSTDLTATEIGIRRMTRMWWYICSARLTNEWVSEWASKRHKTLQ